LFEGGDAVNTYANLLKSRIVDIIQQMAACPQTFSLAGTYAFSRKRNWDFATIIRFILTFGSNSLGHEIGEFLNTKKGSLLYLLLYNNGRN